METAKENPLKTEHNWTSAYILALLAAVIVVYWPVQEFGFLNYDDPVYITGNPHVQKGLSGENIFWAFKSTEAGFWHPLTWLSLILDYELYRLNPAGYHWTNVLLHLGSTLLLFTAFKKMTGANGKSAVVAALFALHPLHVESVAWIAERKDVLSGFFWMLTINAYIHYAVKPNSWRYGIVFVSFFLGLMAKPMLVTLPIVLLLLDVWPLGRIAINPVQGNSRTRCQYYPLKKASPVLYEKIPLMALSIVIGVITYLAQEKFQAIALAGQISFADRLSTAVISPVFYLWKMIWPQEIAAFYPHPGSWPVSWVIVSSTILALITMTVLKCTRQMTCLVVGWLWYLVTLFPVSGIIQVGSHAMADRYTYIPLIGIFIMITWGMSEIFGFGKQSRKFIMVASVATIGLLAILSSIQIKYWRDDGRLFRHALNVTKGNYLAHSGLGAFLMSEGNDQDALVHLQQAITIRPDYEPAWFKLGLLFSRLGRYDDAIFCFQRILSQSPDKTDAKRQLTYNLMLAGKSDEAIAVLREIIHSKPLEAEAYNQLGIVLVKQKKFVEALSAYGEALKINPEHAGIHNNLAMALMRTGDSQEAIRHFRKAIQNQPDYANAHFNLSLLLKQTGFPEEAKKHLEEAIRINPDYGKQQKMVINDD